MFLVIVFFFFSQATVQKFWPYNLLSADRILNLDLDTSCPLYSKYNENGVFNNGKTLYIHICEYFQKANQNLKVSFQKNRCSV